MNAPWGGWSWFLSSTTAAPFISSRGGGEHWFDYLRATSQRKTTRLISGAEITPPKSLYSLMRRRRRVLDEVRQFRLQGGGVTSVMSDTCVFDSHVDSLFDQFYLNTNLPNWWFKSPRGGNTMFGQVPWQPSMFGRSSAVLTSARDRTSRLRCARMRPCSPPRPHQIPNTQKSRPGQNRGGDPHDPRICPRRV